MFRRPIPNWGSTRLFKRNQNISNLVLDTLKFKKHLEQKGKS